jgi:hypothetical protein
VLDKYKHNVEKKNTHWIWRRIVRANSTKKYMTRMGQYTGTSNISEVVQNMAMRVARVEESLDFEMSGKYETRRDILTRTAIQANALRKAEIHHLHG